MAETLRKVYLVDGSGYIFRAYYAIQSLSNREGFPTNALYGFVRMLLKLLSQADSPYVAVVFDAGRKTFRNDLFPDYKANREAAPDDLVKQMPFFREFVRALGVPVLERPGYEADDIIATLARRVGETGASVVVVSGDKDLMQLVGNGVSMWDTMRDKQYGPPEVEDKFGVPPAKVVEVLGLMGDQSDNVPGLPGVGPKTAAQLIAKYGDVDTVLRSAAAIREDKSIRNRNKIAEVIETNAELGRLSRKLVEVDAHVPLDGCGLDENGAADFADLLERREIDSAALSTLITRFDFDSLLREFPDIRPPVPAAAAEYAYRPVLEADFEEWTKEFLAQPEFAFDVETTRLDPFEAELVGLSVCWSDERAFYIPFAHSAGACLHPQVPLRTFIERCGAHFADSRVKKIAQNSKFDISVLAVQGITVEGLAFDTMIASYVLNPDRPSHGLTSLAREYLGRVLIEYDGVVGKNETFSDVALDRAVDYAGQDAHVTWLLSRKLAPLVDEAGVRQLFDTIEMPLVPVLAKMERTGVLLDMQLLAQLSDEFARDIAAYEKQIYELAKGEFNINSPKQLGEVLFGRLGIPTKGLKRTKTGISTDSSVLERLADEHPLPRLILEYRLLHKLKSTYVDALPAQVSARTGRLHTRLNQTVTGTGRLSSSEPNLQNIPIQTAQGRRIREAFIADAAAGNVLISADYSQIELRVLAHLSGDEGLIRAFTEGADIHAATAREVLNLPPDAEISGEQRRMGKTINFGIIYGMSGFRLARDLGIPVGVASEYIAGYFRRFPGVQRLFASIEEEANRNGCVRTLFGRKRVVGSIDASDRDRGFLRRAAMNAPIQGTAADIVKLAMIKLARRIEAERAPLLMLLQIHDELLFECPRAYLDEARTLIMGEMERVADLRVPLKVELGYGAHWEEAHG